MIRHIVAWNLKDGFSETENTENAKRIKAELEELQKLIREIVSISVSISPASTSDRQIILNSLFKSQEDLESYKIHPAHIEVGKFIRSVVKDRVCLDFEE